MYKWQCNWHLYIKVYYTTRLNHNMSHKILQSNVDFSHTSEINFKQMHVANFIIYYTIILCCNPNCLFILYVPNISNVNRGVLSQSHIHHTPLVTCCINYSKAIFYSQPSHFGPSHFIPDSLRVKSSWYYAEQNQQNKSIFTRSTFRLNYWLCILCFA